MDATDRRRPLRLPRVVADLPLDATIESLLRDRVTLLPWSVTASGTIEPVDGLYTYGHPQVDGAMLERLAGLKVISNYGVGVDHIDLAASMARGIPVGNTPGVLEATTADMGFALLLASARRVVEGDRYAHSAEFLRYDPGYMLGREVHGQDAGNHRHGPDRPPCRPAGDRLRHDRPLPQPPPREDVERDLAPSVRFAEQG